MRAALREDGVALPWPWAIARWCLNWADGSVRHFPAGTYVAQMARHFGATELELMNVCYRAWDAFEGTPLDKWTARHTNFAGWLAQEPEPPRIELNELIRLLWQITFLII